MGRKLSITLPSFVLTAILLFTFIPPVVSAADGYDVPLDSRWQEIDNEFTPAIAPWNWQMLDADYHLRVKEDFTAGQIIEFEVDGSTVQFQPMGLEWSNNLSQIQSISMPQDVTPVVTNPEVDMWGTTKHQGTITWNNAYGSNIDFEWKSTPRILNKTLTIESLSDLPVPQQYIIDGGEPFLRLNLIFDPSTDLDIYVDNDMWDKATKVQTFNDIEFRKDGQRLWSIIPLLYWDSTGNEGQSVATLEKSGNKLYISVRVPYSWLQTAIYPVYIDADVQIEAAASINQNFMPLRGGIFWTSPTVGYAIYCDQGSDLVYNKTSNGGATWDGAVSIAVCDALKYDCWADWQTAGDAGTKIHIAYMSLDDEEVRYVYLDTSGDSVAGDDLIETCQGTGTFYSASYIWSHSMISITKTRGGNLVVTGKYKDSDQTAFSLCYTSPDADTWTSKTSPYDADTDYCILFPANLADNQDVWGAYWDTSGDEIFLKTFDDSGNSWSAGTSISGSMVETTAYIQMDGVIRLSDEHLLFAAWSEYDSATADLKTWDINGEGSITAKTNVKTDAAEYGRLSTFINQDNDDWYVSYAGGTALGSLVKVFYQKSTDGGGTWTGSDTAMQADAEDDERWISCGAVKAAWGGKFQPFWFNDDNTNLFCNTTYGISIAAAGVVAPTVITNAATSVEETTATASGNLTATGGENCTDRGFQWDIDTGAPYADNWTEAGSFGVGNFTHGITALTEGELYYYRAGANNTAGWGWGAEVTFLTKPDEPNTLVATGGYQQVSLSWNKGTGADNTTITAKLGSYPANRADGTVIYDDTGTNTNHTGLGDSEHWYYRAWSWCTEGGKSQYSDIYAQDDATTLTPTPPAPPRVPAIPLPQPVGEKLSLVLAGCAVIFFSELGFWRQNALLFMLAGGASLMVGLQWYDVYVTSTGLTAGLMLIAYSFVCIAFAFRYLFWRRDIVEE